MEKVGRVYPVSVHRAVWEVSGGVDAKCISNANGKDLKTTHYNVKVKHKAKCECFGKKQSLWHGQSICLLFIKKRKCWSLS